jgi:hypothetical protein
MARGDQATTSIALHKHPEKYKQVGGGEVSLMLSGSPLTMSSKFKSAAIKLTIENVP